MPTVKKASLALVPNRELKKELEHLYARRSALDALIQSLEDYNRWRIQRIANQKRQTA